MGCMFVNYCEDNMKVIINGLDNLKTDEDFSVLKTITKRIEFSKHQLSEVHLTPRNNAGWFEAVICYAKDNSLDDVSMVVHAIQRKPNAEVEFHS